MAGQSHRFEVRDDSKGERFTLTAVARVGDEWNHKIGVLAKDLSDSQHEVDDSLSWVSELEIDAADHLSEKFV